MATTTLSSKYQIVIPKSVRARMRLAIGEVVTVHTLDSDRAILIRHTGTGTNALRGLGKEVWKKLGGAEKYIRQERTSWSQ